MIGCLERSELFRREQVVNIGSGVESGVVAGSLAAYEPLVRTELARMDYAASSVRATVQAMGRLSDWLAYRGVSVQALTPDIVKAFRAAQRPRIESGLGAALRVLREHGVVPVQAISQEPVDVLMADYRRWLVAERGLAAETVRCYGNQAKTFLGQLPVPLGEVLLGLDAAAVTGFMVEQANAAGSVESAKALVTAMRSLLRFLHVDGRITVPLVGAVPAVAGWRLGSLPRGLQHAQVGALLAAHDLTTPVGLRDHAVVSVLARLGLRGAEVAALRLDDMDWHRGEILVRGKGSRIERLPLPVQVGQALADYLTGGRPRCSCLTVFVTARAPYRPLVATSIRATMYRACQQAGLPRLGAHRLRHTLATDMLRAGASLVEVGQVLRHRSQLSTTVYAKVDHEALRTLTRPWPEAAR
jgi:integrase/recombinase XerD